jgi:hypothetical protein
MLYKCRKIGCKREFEKPSHRNQHEKDAHGEPTSYKVGSKTGLTLRHAAQESCGFIDIEPEFKEREE